MANHPDLNKKLKLLYHLRVNPKISSNTELAAEFGISKQAVSRWIHGSETRHGDHIPTTQLKNIADLFQLKEHWFALPYEGFEKKLFALLESKHEPQAVLPVRISISQLPTTSAQVFGRERELRVLNEAWQSNTTNIVQLVAFGGVGKSCLVNHWLSQVNEGVLDDARQIYGWSFYWQGASSDIRSSGDFFIENALEWFGDDDPSKGAPWSKASRLAKLIRQSRTLLILDGVEPLQCPPGPNGGHIENPAIAYLIKELAIENNGLCVITTRLAVADLETYSEKAVNKLIVKNLSSKNSAKLLQYLGVRGTNIELNRAVQKYSGHPLSLILLGGYLSIVYSGDIKHFEEIASLFDEKNQGEQAKKIMQSYLDWFSDRPEKDMLFFLGLMDRATSKDELQKMVALEDIPNLTNLLRGASNTDWLYAIRNLRDAKLISVTECDGDYEIDCHPIIRDLMSDTLRSENKKTWAAGHNLIFKYLIEQPVSESLTMKDLEPLFRSIIHGTRAGLYNEAFEVYYYKIKQSQFSLFALGSHYADQACIRTFFKQEWSVPVHDLNEDAKYYLLTSAAINLIYLGNIKEAIKPARISIDWFIKMGKWLEAASASAPLVSMLIASGQLAEAEDLIENMQYCVVNTNNVLVDATAHTFKAFVNYLSGKKDEADLLFKKSERVIISLRPESPVLYPTISSYYCKFLLETGELDQALERSLKTFGWRDRNAWQVSIDTTSLYASDLLVLGLTFLARGDLINAKRYLDLQVELFRSADEWLYLPTGLHSRARYYIEVKDFATAITDLEEALTISTRTGAVFGEWESYLNFAHLHFIQNNAEQCGSYLRKARALPNMHLYKFRDDEIAKMEKFAGLPADYNTNVT